jgi:RNA polymerase primary sigma factor
MKLICYLYIFFSCFFFISSITQINSKLRKKSKITETKINSIVTYITELARDNPNVFEEIKNNKPLTKKEERNLWKRFREKNDLSAREALIKANLKFVPSVAKQFKGCGLPFADIIEEGNIGLVTAIDRFDPKKDNKVISYAIWWIRKCILEAIEKKGTIDAENLDDITQTEDIVKDEQEENNNSKIIVPEKVNFDEATDYPMDAKQILEELFDGVPERERFIVSDYYGLDGVKPKTLDEIGIEFNLTKERVRQLNEKALRKMRSNALLKNLSFTGF